MESVLLSQQTLSQVIQLNFVDEETVAKLCKYFLQSLIMGSSTMKLGVYMFCVFDLRNMWVIIYDNAVNFCECR